MSTRQASQRAGFTLIEVLAAIALTSVVVGAAVGFYINLSQASVAATSLTREGRQAMAVLDRVARDLTGAYLLEKPEATDPLEHPWVFLAESRTPSGGADHLKFMTRSYRPPSDQPHTSDLATITYQVRSAADYEGYELLRWVTPRLPPALDRDFPGDDENALVLADGLAEFGVRFLSGDEWVDEWDSSTLVQSSRLPLAAEIELALLSEDEIETGVLSDEEPELYRRRVVLPLRTIPLQAMLDGEIGFFGAGEDDSTAQGEQDFVDEDGDGRPDNCQVTWGECMDRARNTEALIDRLGQGGFQDLRSSSFSAGCADESVRRGLTRIAGVRVGCR